MAGQEKAFPGLTLSPKPSEHVLLTICLTPTHVQDQIIETTLVESVYEYASSEARVAICEHAAFTSMDDIRNFIDLLDTEYVIFFGDTHNISEHFLPVLVSYLAENDTHDKPLYAHGHVFLRGLREESTLSTFRPNNYLLLEAYQHIYGCAYSIDMLKRVTLVYADYDIAALHAIYRLYTHEYQRKKLPVGYTLNDVTHMGKGLNPQASRRVVPVVQEYEEILECEELDMRLYILNIVQLYVRFSLLNDHTLPFSLAHIANVVQRYKLDEVSGASVYEYPIERSLLLWLNGDPRNEYLFNYEREFDVFLCYHEYPLAKYPYFTYEQMKKKIADDMRDHEHPMYLLAFSDAYVAVTRLYKPHVSFNNPERFDYYSKPITPDSMILFFDRLDKADDNAEHLYRYIMHNRPEFTNIWFAVEANTPCFERLEAEGFRLIPTKTSAFRDVYLRADMIVSSQVYLLRPLGKSAREFRFVYLQHGIILNNLRPWVERKRFDKFITTSLYETNLISQIAPKEVVRSGLPRLQTLMRKRKDFLEHANDTAEKKRFISFLPSWRFALSQVTDDGFMESDFYKRIQALFDDEKLQAYLREHNVTCLIKWHPNTFSLKHMFVFDKDVFQETNDSYTDVLAQSELAITDFSSVVLDAAFCDVPICYYQWDAQEFYDSQPFEPGLDLHAHGAGPIFEEHEDVIAYIVNKVYTKDASLWKERKKALFGKIDASAICDTIIDEMLAC